MDYETFVKKAIQEYNLCGEYTEILSKHHSNKQLYDLLCSPKGIDYMCDAIAKGWGISDDVLLKRLNPFMNGKYTADYKEYNSKLYCCFNGNLIADTTIVGIIDSDCIIEIPQNEICEIYLTGKCNVLLIGEGKCVCICYGKYDNIVIDNQCKNMKRINKQHADKYE